MHIKEPRQQLDHMLRETRIHLISFSHMADTKANILLSISSVLLSISLTRVSDPRFTGALIVLVGFLLITSFLALLTVIPRGMGSRSQNSTLHAPPYPPFYFGNYAATTYDAYLKDLEEIMNDSDRTY